MPLRTIALAVATLLLLAGPAAAREALEGSGELETRTLDLAEFTKIDLGGAFDVTVAVGRDQKVEITVDDNLWENLDATVDDGRLAIDWDRNCRPTDGCTVRITMARLEEFNLHGAGDVDIRGLGGDALTFYLRGAGDARLAGQVDELTIYLTGAGNCVARGLEAKDVKVRVSGVGNCEVHASASLDAEVSGVGNVTYWGSPDEKSVQVSGMGSIDAR